MDTSDRHHLKAYAETGSQEAFEALVEAHADLVTRIVGKRVSDPDEASDLVQIVFCRLATKAPTLAKHPTVSGWLIRTAILECLKFHRTETNRMKREAAYAANQADLASDKNLFDEEDVLAIEDALAQLSPPHRDVVMLRYYERASFKDIGYRIGKSEGSAQKMVSRAVERLRRIVQRRGSQITASTGLFTAALTGTLTTSPLPAKAAKAIALAAIQTSAPSPVLTQTLISIMTANQIKLTVGITLLVALLPVSYHLNQRQQKNEVQLANELASGDRTPTATHNTSQINAPLQPESADSLTSQHSLTVPIDWKQQRYQSLIDDLADGEWKIRRGAAALLKDREVPAEVAVPALNQALKDEQWHVRKEVAKALASYGEDALAAVPGLIEALNDEEWHVRKPAAEALEAIGSQAAPDAGQALVAALSDEEWQVRNAAAMALVSVPTPESVSALSNALADDEWHVAANAAMALASIGTDADDSVSDLIGALDHKEWHVRNGAAYALGMIGNSRAVQALNARLGDDESRVRETATEALKHLAQSP